jgi:hypothetical protein
MATFTLTAGIDNFTGNAGENNLYELGPATLQATDTVNGGATAGFYDILVATAGGTLTAGQFAGVTGTEMLYLAYDGTNVTLSDSLVAGSSIGVFAVVGRGGNDTVDASGITNATPIAYYAAAGSDTFIGSSGLNLAFFAAGDLTAADTVTGGAATDAIVLTTAGALAASAFSNVTGIESLHLSAGGNAVTLTNGLVAGSSTGVVGVVGGAGNDTVDASGVTNGVSVAFYGNGGGDSFIGSSGFNISYFDAGDLTAADTVTGGVGMPS